MTNEAPKQENGFLNIIFNILIPVLILNKLSSHIGSLYALFLAISFPLAYGSYDLIKRRKFNPLALLGLLNVLFTGGLALLGLNGFWFAVKEATFPALIGLFVLASAFTKKPFIETIFLNPSLMKTDLLTSRLQELGKGVEFHQHLKKATYWLSVSFLFSAFLNFALARIIFLDIDPSLTAEAQSLILNDQIAKMTTWSMAVIMVPSIVFLLGIFWYLLKGIKDHTGLTTEDLMKES